MMHQIADSTLPECSLTQVSKDPESGEVIHSSGVRTESSIRVTKAFIHEIFRCHSMRA